MIKKENIEQAKRFLNGAFNVITKTARQNPLEAVSLTLELKEIVEAYLNGVKKYLPDVDLKAPKNLVAALPWLIKNLGAIQALFTAEDHLKSAREKVEKFAFEHNIVYK
jgi:ribosomal protein S7